MFGHELLCIRDASFGDEGELNGSLYSLENGQLSFGQ